MLQVEVDNIIFSYVHVILQYWVSLQTTLQRFVLRNLEAVLTLSKNNLYSIEKDIMLLLGENKSNKFKFVFSNKIILACF